MYFLRTLFQILKQLYRECTHMCFKPNRDYESTIFAHICESLGGAVHFFLYIAMSVKERPYFKPNVRNWVATETFYRLVFFQVDGVWREVSNNLARFYNVTLANYLETVHFAVPDECEYCRICRDNLVYEYRDYGSHIRIDVHEKW